MYVVPDTVAQTMNVLELPAARMVHRLRTSIYPIH